PLALAPGPRVAVVCAARDGCDGGGGNAGVFGRTVGRSDVFLGADAGGSHTTVVIGTADLTILGRADGPPAAMKPGGAPASAAVRRETGRRAGAQRWAGRRVGKGG